MDPLTQDPVRRRTDGSIDLEHYLAVARCARAEEAGAMFDTLWSTLRARAIELGLRRRTLG